MKKLLIAFLFLSGISKGSSILEEFSKVEFEVSNMAVSSVEGTFTGMTGTIDFDPENPTEGASFDVCIDASTINTGNEKRDAHLKTEDFFHVDSFPKICFQSTNVVAEGDHYKTTGTLTMHGVSKEVTIQFTYVDDTFVGELVINRDDFKVGEEVGAFTVGKEISIKITCKVRP